MASKPLMDRSYEVGFYTPAFQILRIPFQRFRKYQNDVEAHLLKVDEAMDEEINNLVGHLFILSRKRAFYRKGRSKT